jgi:hypothetical protein
MGTLTVMAGNAAGFNARIYRAVKAELARRGKDGMDLVPVLGLGRNAVYDRLRGSIPFDVLELGKVVEFLGISLETLLASADLDDEPALEAVAS